MAQDKKEMPRWVGGVEPARELLTATGTQILEIECREQPERLRGCSRPTQAIPQLQAELKKFRELAAKTGPVLFIGMGASYCSSISGSVLLQSHGRPSFSVDAGEWLHYASSVWDDAALSVLLTTSGESAELVELLQKRRGPARLDSSVTIQRAPAGILRKTGSPSWRDRSTATPPRPIPMRRRPPLFWRRRSSSLPWKREAERAAEVFSSHLDPIFAMRSDLEEFCRGAANIEVIGRGAAYGGAFMSALCIREMSGHRAAAHTGAGFKHGPNLDVDATHVAIIFALGRAAQLGIKLAQECNRRGGKVVLVSSEDQSRERTNCFRSGSTLFRNHGRA